ncbi:hypothetical protein [Mammaliicoccus sp. A-M4]|uniref:hypothetical protein n=1 Tax=Mammaliicoccus sp. A-M4 TaxID=2898664 RepID=UPI001EFAD612|nr:hypothetical protein [Mammaliicoccus sp. A-M4]
MPTIKIKKEMNLPQLIEWGFKNNIKNAVYNSKNGLSVNFSFDGKAVIGYAFSEEDTFTVEIEEPITEDAEIKGLVEFGNDGYGPHFFQCSGSSINEQKDIDSEAFYIMNEDKTITLIWTKEKGLVE